MVEAFEVNVEGDQSPFAEVAACVSNVDPDPEIQLNHFRTWCVPFLPLFSFLLSIQCSPARRPDNSLSAQVPHHLRRHPLRGGQPVLLAPLRASNLPPLFGVPY